MVKLCKDCKFCNSCGDPPVCESPKGQLVTGFLDYVNGHYIMPCQSARMISIVCGPEAKWFEPIPTPPLSGKNKYSL